MGVKDYIISDFCTNYEPQQRDCHSIITTLLNSGEALVILDALDETGDKFRRLCDCIEHFIDKFPSCRIIITSRLSTEYPQFPGFKQWEIELFDDEQSQQCIRKLFFKDLSTSNKDWTSQEISQELDKMVSRFFDNLSEVEVAADFKHHPLSLIYLGMLYLDNYGISSSMPEIYGDVIDIFLRKWDKVRNIRERIPNYQNKLTRTQRTKFFQELAFNGLKNSVTVWKAKEIKTLLINYLKKLSIIHEDDIETVTEFMLKVFIMDDGLLVPITHDYYSFPFLPFQEYFSAQYLFANQEKLNIRRFINDNLLDKKWKSTLIMHAELLPNADQFFSELFSSICYQFLDNQKLQEILRLVYVASKKCNLNTTSWRAQMLMLDNPLDLLISRQTPLPDNDLIGISKLTKQFNEKRKKTHPNQGRFIIALYSAIAYALVQDKYFRSPNGQPTLRESHPAILEGLAISEKVGVQEEIQWALEQAIESKEEGLIPPLLKLQADLPHDNADAEKWLKWCDLLMSFMTKYPLLRQ